MPAKPLKHATKAAARLNPLDCVREIATAWSDYAKVREEEETARTQILADEAVRLEEIRAKERLFLTYLERSFDERATNFAELFKQLDRCVDRGDVSSVAVILKAVVDLAQSGPFRELADPEGVRRMLAATDEVLEL